MTIHADHPFSEPEHERDPLRRFRGRLGAAVSLWTTGSGAARAGLTVSSLLVAPGEPGRVLALVDPDSALAQTLSETGTAVVQLLRWVHRDLADAFAGVAPAPGGPFRLGEWEASAWGPVLAGVSAWAGVRVYDEPRPVGWSVLVEAVVEHVQVSADAGEDALVHRRGRYVRPAAGG